jgi:hypothetical protein
MYLSSPLEWDQVYANVSVNIRKGFFLVYFKTEVYITADIISKRGGDEYFFYLNRVVDEYNKKIVAILKEGDVSGFVLDEKVYSYNPKSKTSNIGYIQDNEGNIYHVAAVKKHPSESFSKNKKDIFKIENIGELQSLIGQSVMIPNSEMTAIIIGINPYTKDLLVKPNNKKIRRVSLDLLK